jgi:hypothetical protein
MVISAKNKRCQVSFRYKSFYPKETIKEEQIAPGVPKPATPTRHDQILATFPKIITLLIII